jgi:prepilin-type N-terminal cleavage/methylation domain-containing protein/prepilin-type processing-associated H-X9-DG protein
MKVKTRAFTLLELLVVITIIGILAAMLLPALSRSKASARRIDCLSHTKQLALAATMYGQDNVDSLPWPNWGAKFQGWLYTPVGGMPPAPTNPPENAYLGGTLWSYVKATTIYWCPEDNPNSPYFQQRLEKLSSYVMNGGIMGYYIEPLASRTHKLAQMNPSACLSWEPTDSPPYDPAHVFNDGASLPRSDEGPSRPHGAGCNVSFFDGHARLFKFSDFQREQSTQPGVLWCDPDTPDGTGGTEGRDCGLWK